MSLSLYTVYNQYIYIYIIYGYWYVCMHIDKGVDPPPQPPLVHIGDI